MFSKKLIPQVVIKSLVCDGNEFHTDVLMLEIILLGNVTVVLNEHRLEAENLSPNEDSIQAVTNLG
jgi:hypothetical protein